jgi:hypothetical protein
MDWTRVINTIGIGIYTTVIVLIFNGLLEYLAKDIGVNLFSFVGLVVVLAGSLFVIGHLVNRIVLYYSE